MGRVATTRSLVFPANAGVSRSGRGAGTRRTRIPRERGGEPEVYSPSVRVLKYSPRTRG